MDIEGFEPSASAWLPPPDRAAQSCVAHRIRTRTFVQFMGLDPEDYLSQLFQLYNHLMIISNWGDSLECRDSRSVMAYWNKRNRELTHGGQLPDGVLHFDIVATNR